MAFSQCMAVSYEFWPVFLGSACFSRFLAVVCSMFVAVFHMFRLIYQFVPFIMDLGHFSWFWAAFHGYWLFSLCLLTFS